MNESQIEQMQNTAGERIKELEAQVAGYERLLDEAYDQYLSGCTADELKELLKELLEYAPRRNWEGK